MLIIHNTLDTIIFFILKNLTLSFFLQVLLNFFSTFHDFAKRFERVFKLDFIYFFIFLSVIITILFYNTLTLI